jgi:hypothetical protein
MVNPLPADPYEHTITRHDLGYIDDPVPISRGAQYPATPKNLTKSRGGGIVQETAVEENVSVDRLEAIGHEPARNRVLPVKTPFGLLQQVRHDAVSALAGYQQTVSLC